MTLRLRTSSGTARDFSAPVVHLGRDPQCELTTPADDGAVSWRHARVELSGEAAILYDAGSTNGTFVNGKRLSSPHPLRPGDRVSLGESGPAFDVVEVSGGGVSATRAMLLRMRSGQRGLWSLAFLVVTGLSAGGAFWLWKHEGRLNTLESIVAAQGVSLDEVREAAARIDKDTKSLFGKVKRLELSRDPRPEDVYAKALVSTAFIQATGGNGTGVLIDRKRRLVATAYHVIHDQKPAEGGAEDENAPSSSSPGLSVVFPRFLGGKVLDQEPMYDGKDVIKAKVWASDPGRDLAILQLESVPAHVPEMPLATATPAKGSAVHAVGGKPERSVGLWASTVGNVQQTGKDKLALNTGQEINARLIQSSNPINRGDSGGPLVNNQGKLVGIASGTPDGVRGMALFIDVAEVREVLDKRPNRRLEKLTAYKFIPEEVKADQGSEGVLEAEGTDEPIRPGTQAVSGGEGKVWVLLLIDTLDPNITPSTKRDFERMVRLLAWGVPRHQLHISYMHDRALHTNNIARYYRSVPVGPNDTLLCYYSGHGAFSGDHHYLCAWGGGHSGASHNVPRNFVLNEMLRRRPRLTVMLTDCCSNYANGVQPGTQGANFPQGARGPMTNLLLRHRGLIDWTASLKGTAAYGDVFTPALVEEIAQRQGRLSWPEVFHGVDGRTRPRQRPLSLHYHVGQF